MWWENLKKIHLPEERMKLTRDELIELTKETQRLCIEVRKIELRESTPLQEMIDFKKLKKAFFREYKYAYGKTINPSIKETRKKF